MKKFILLLLSLSFLIFPLVCCSKEEKKDPGESVETTAGTSESTEEPYYLDTFDADKYAGFDSISIATIDTNIVLDEMPETADEVDRQKYARDERLEEKFHLTFHYTEIKNKNDAEEAKYMLNLVQANMEAVDFFIQQPDNLMYLAINGATKNLLEIDTLNLEKTWWSQFMNQNLKFKGGQYVASGPVAEWYYGSALVLAYNKTMANDYQIGNLYDWIFDGTWTLEKMSEICHNEDLLNVEKGRYAMSFAQGVGPYGFFASAGGKFCTVNEEDGICVELNSQENINLLEKITQAYNVKNMYRESVRKTAEMFTSGNAFFYFSSMGWISNFLPESSVQYGIIPCPKYDEAQSKYISCAWPSSNYAAAIPTSVGNAESTEWAGMILEAYCFLGYEMIKPVKYDALFKYQVAPDESSSRILDLIFDNMYFDINLVSDLGGSRTLVGTALKQGMDGFVGSYMGIKPLIDADIEKYASLTHRQ